MEFPARRFARPQLVLVRVGRWCVCRVCGGGLIFLELLVVIGSVLRNVTCGEAEVCLFRGGIVTQNDSSPEFAYLARIPEESWAFPEAVL